MKKNAIVLCRISDIKQDEGYSLDAQEKYAKAYCKMNHFNILEVFSFVETGSKSLKRQKFDKMMAFIRDYVSKKSSVKPLSLIVEKPDRLTRNFTNREQLQFFVMTGNLEIHYYKDKRVFDKNCSPADIFTEDMMTSVSKYMALNTARESLKGMREKASQGWFPGHAPLGYKNIRTGFRGKHGRKEARIIVDPETKKAAQRIFELRSKGFSYDAISKTVLKEGLLPLRKSKSFSSSSVDCILNNSFYTGKFKWKGEVFQGKHKLIIPEKWLKVAELKRGRSHKLKHIGIFSHFMSCDVCGSPIIYDPKTKVYPKTQRTVTHHYYHCADGRRKHKELGLRQINITEEKLWDQMAKPLRDVRISKKLALEIFKALDKEQQKAKKREKSKEKSFKDKIKFLEQKEDRLYEDFTKNFLDELSYKRNLQRLKDEKKDLENLYKAENSVSERDFLKKSESLLELANSAESLWKTRSETERLDLIKKLCSNVSLDGLSVRYSLRKPFDILHKMKPKKTWCPPS